MYSAEVLLSLVVFVGMWGVNYKALKCESSIKGQEKLEFVETFLDAS